MDFKQLHTFRTVATLENFNKAADILDYAQSTVSDQIKQLENHLGVKLFNREGKTVSLTRAGELLLKYSQKIIDLEDEILSEIKQCDEIRGSLTIKIPETISTYFLPEILKKYNKKFPKVDFVFNPCAYHGLHEELKSGIIDLAFLITDSFHAVDLDTIILSTLDLVMVTYPSNPILSINKVKPFDLKNEPIYITASDCNYFKIIQEYFIEAKVDMQLIISLSTIESIKRNIMGGVGTVVLPRIAVQKELENGELAEVDFEKKSMKADITMIWIKNKWRMPILDDFMSISKEIIQRNNNS
ncbi:MAG: LysR family transcriptional regulator [Spirochaetes bacterium]|nr:LysR family transcriptional regulator [Spirochaetota bacterium]